VRPGVHRKLARRPELDKALLSANRPGDQLVVTKLDRLGRSLDHFISLSKDLQASGIDLVVLDQGIDTSTAIGRMFFQILGAIAEFEHALMSERTLDGLAAARARGRTGGQNRSSPRGRPASPGRCTRRLVRTAGAAIRSRRLPLSSASPAPPSTGTSAVR
jgi:DNA invertase Pin-like site-specific DNA recombinase